MFKDTVRRVCAVEESMAALNKTRENCGLKPLEGVQRADALDHFFSCVDYKNGSSRRTKHLAAFVRYLKIHPTAGAVLVADLVGQPRPEPIDRPWSMKSEVPLGGVDMGAFQNVGDVYQKIEYPEDPAVFDADFLLQMENRDSSTGSNSDPGAMEPLSFKSPEYVLIAKSY